MTDDFVSGEKVGLRGIERNDLPKIAEWLNDSEVTYYMVMGAQPTQVEYLEQQWEKEICDAAVCTFAICDLEDGTMVGWCGLYGIHPVSHRAEFRVFIGDKSCWNKGFATDVGYVLVKYAFEQLNLNKVTLGVNASSEAAVNCYEKVGFVEEGVLREEIYRNGQYYDAVRMSILKREYFGGCKSS